MLESILKCRLALPLANVFILLDKIILNSIFLIKGNYESLFIAYIMAVHFFAGLLVDTQVRC